MPLSKNQLMFFTGEKNTKR